MSGNFGIPDTLPLKYTGPESAIIPLKPMPRRPTVNDRKYPVGQFAILKKNPTTGIEGELWYLSRFTSTGDPVWVQITAPMGTSDLVQQQRTDSSAITLINTEILVDNSKPQQNEGTEVLTCTITPTSDTSKLVIEFEGFAGTGANSTFFTVALFQDAGMDAIDSRCFGWNNNGVYTSCISLKHTMTSGTFLPITFKIRMGTHVIARPVYLNGGYNATTGAFGALYGGIPTASLIVSEYLT